MDWSPTEMQGLIAETARPILAANPAGWSELANAELLGVESMLDITALLVQVGRTGGRVPALETLVLGAPARSLRELPSDVVLTGALVEEGRRDPRDAATRSEGGRLFGKKVAVSALDRAALVVVPARDGLWVVDPRDAVVEPARATNGDVFGTLVLDGTPALQVGDREAIAPYLNRVHVGVCALHLGLSQKALELTAAYVGQREQFGRKIGTFQAVAQRIADGAIDLAGMDATLIQAAWRLDAGLPADREVLIARATAAEGSHRIVAAAQHLHGGFGFDRDYELHRYFLTSKTWEFLLGGSNSLLDSLGDLLAAQVH